MKIAMLLPLLPLHAAAEELRKLTTTIDKTATTKTVSGTLSDGTTPECGLKNTFGTKCLAEWKEIGFMFEPEEIFNKHCVSTEPAYHIDCRSCQWCSGVTDTATIKPVADTVNADFIDCTHKNCLQWTCKNWCHCYEEKFDEIYAYEKCVGEDTCNCGEMDNGPIDEPLINTDWKEIFYLYACRNEGLPSKLYTLADVKYMKVMVESLHYEKEVDCEAELKARGDTALTKTDRTESRETELKVVTAEDTTSTTVTKTAVTTAEDTIICEDNDNFVDQFGRTGAWEDSHSATCDDYRTNGWCKVDADGKSFVDSRYAGFGAEQNCCGCGREERH